MPAPNTGPVWDDGPFPSPPPLAGDVRADVCVIGLGGSGLTCIEELVRAGRRVVGLDAGDVGGGAAGRNGGFLLAGTASFYHKSVGLLGRERARAMYDRSLREVRRLLADFPGIVRHTGSLRIAWTPDEEDDCREQLDAMRADGLAAEPYDGPEGRGLLFPHDAVFNPLRRCRTLAERLQDAGASLHSHSPALDIDAGVVTTPNGRVLADAVVIAVDGRLERLVPETRGTVRTVRLQMLATAPTDEIRLERPVYARYGFEYWQQLPNGRVALGGFRDHGGDDEYTEDTDPSERIQERLERHLREHLNVRAPITHRWAASVGYTEGRLPFFGEVRPGVWALGGYSGTGNVIGAILGRAAAECVMHGACDDIRLFGRPTSTDGTEPGPTDAAAPA